MPTLLTLERPLSPPTLLSRRSSIIIPTILHDERHPHSLTDLSPFLFFYPLSLPVEQPHSTMDIQQAQDLLKKFSLGKYALPSGITPGSNPQAEHLYHMTQALRDASGGTPIVQALAQIPTYQQALVQQAIPTEKFAQVNAILAQLERREMNEAAAASALRQLATTPVTSQLGQLSQNISLPTASRTEREAQISAAQPRIGAWQDRTAQNAGVSLDKVKSVFKSFSDEQLAAVEAPDQTRVIKSGGGGGKTDVVVAMITDAVVNRGMRAQDFTVLVATHSAEGELVRRLTDIGNTIPQMRLDWAGQVKTFHAKAMSTLNQRVMQASGQAMTPLQAMGMGNYTPFPSSSSSSRKAAPKNAEEAFRAQTQEEFKYFQNLLTHHGVRVQQSANLFQQIQAIKAEHGYDGQYKDMGIRGAQSWASGKKDAFESLLYMYEKARMNDPQFKLPSQTGPHYDLADSIILAARAGERGKTQPWKNTVVDEMQDPTRQMYRMLAAQTRKPAGYRFFAGDEGQRTIKSGGSYQAGQAIQEMFPSAKAFALTGNYRLGPINTALYSATQMEHVLDNRGRAPFQISMRAGGAEAFPSMYTAQSFKQVNEQMFADYLKQQGLTHGHIEGNIQAGVHPLTGAASAGSMPFVFQMKEQRRYFLKSIEHDLSQKFGPARAKAAVRQMFNLGTPQGTGGGSQAHALLVNQTLGKSFPHVFADITRVGSKWSDADYMEQMGVIASRPTEQLHAYSSQTNIAGSNYTLAPDTLHGQAVPTGMATWYQWMLHNLVGVQGMSPSSLSAADQQLLASPMASRVQAPARNLSSFQGFVEDAIKLIPHARPSAGAGIGTPAIHSATSVGVTSSSERYGDESTTVNGISDRGSFQRILGTAKPEPDKTRIDLIVGYARNLLEQAGTTTLHMKGMIALPGNQGFMVNEGASTWETQDQDELSIENLMKSGMFGYQGGKERKAANKEITDYMAPTTSDDWSPYFNEKSRLMSGDHDRYGYRGADERKLRQGISDFLSSDLVRQHPQIKPLIEGAFTRESVRNVVADPKNAPNTYERQIFTQSPVIKTIQDYAYAQRSDEGQQLLQQVNAASEQGRLDPFIRNLVNNPKDDLLREEILNKAADVVSFGYLPSEAIEAIKSAAEEFNYPTLTKLIDAYGDTLYSADNSQVGLRQVDMDYIKANHPREHALLLALAEKSGVDLSNLEDPAVQKQLSMLPHVAGQMTRAAGEKGQSLGIPIAESAFAPFTTEMIALHHTLSKAGILDPMALRSGSIDDVLMNISPDMSHALLHQLPGALRGGGKTLPILGQDALLGSLSPLEREASLGLPAQSEGVGVGLESYQKRLEDMLHLHQGSRPRIAFGPLPETQSQFHKYLYQGGRPRVAYGSATKLNPLASLHTPLLPEQAQGYQSELEQVKSLRKTLGDPSFQLESGHLLNMVHRVATGESAIDKNVKGEHNQPYARFMAPLKNQFGEGNRTLGSIGELVSSLQEGTHHVQGTGTLSRAHTNRILEALGHDPGEFENLANLESLAGFGEGSSLPLTALAAQFPSEQKNLLAQFTRFPFKEGQTAAFLGGMPGFTDIAPLGQEKAGLHAGMVGTLHPINKGISFGLPTDYGDFKKHGLFTESEWKEHGPRAQDPEFLKQVAEPLAMLRTRGGKQYPVRLSQVSDLYAKGLHPDAQEMLDISRHNVMTGDIKGAVSRRGHRDIRVQGWLKTPSGQRYLARQAKQNEPAPVPLKPSRALQQRLSKLPHYTTNTSRSFVMQGGRKIPYRQFLQGGGTATAALSPSLRAQIEGGANETQTKIPVSNTPPPEAFMPEGFIGGSLGAASPHLELYRKIVKQRARLAEAEERFFSGDMSQKAYQYEVDALQKLEQQSKELTASVSPPPPLPPPPPPPPPPMISQEPAPDPIGQLHQTLLSHPDQQSYGGSIAPDAMSPSPPQLEEPLPASQLEMLAKGLREGNSNWGIHPPSDEQKQYMLDPATRTVLEGGPGTGKTATGVRGQMYQVATGAILPRNTFAFSAIRSATSRLAGEYGKYRKLLPSGKDYDFPTPRTFASIAASTVLHPENDENNQSYFPMLQKLGYKHLTGEVMGDPTAQDLYGKDEETQVKMMRTSQKAFLTEQINASLVASGKKPWDRDSQALRDAQKYIGETKKSRMGGYGTYEQITRGEKVAQEPYSHGIQKGLKDLAAGQMTQEAALVLHEQGMRHKGGMDWDDLFSIATEAYQKFGPQALPTVFKHIEAILIDEGQDVNPLMASLQKHFIGALSTNNPRVTVAMDPMQSLTQGMGGIPLGEIRGSIRDILGIPESTPFHQLSQNFRSDAGTVAFHNALLQSPHLAGSPHSPLQEARSGKPGKPARYILGKTQPDVYRQIFRSRLAATGVPMAQIKQNIKSGQHPFTGFTLQPKEIATILPRNQDVDLFEHVAKQELANSLGLQPHEAHTVFSQMMRQGMPPASMKEGSPEWEQAQMQMPLLKFMGSRGNEYQDVALDASLTGLWQRNEDIPGHMRNLFVGGTRTSQGGQTTIGAAELPFNFAEAQRYMQGGGMNLARMAYGKRGSANTFENFQGQQVPRFFRDLSQGAHTQLQQWGMNPDAGRKVVDSNLVVNAKDVKMNIPPGGSVSIQGTNVQAPGGINIVRSASPPPPGSKWAAASSAPSPNNLPPAAPSSSATGFNPFAPPRRGGPLGSYAGTGMGNNGPGNTININATGTGGPGGPPPNDGGGRGGGYNNAASQFGRSMARLGYELQFMGKFFGDIVTQSLTQGSEYRLATGGLPGSGANSTEGFYNFASSQGGISAYQSSVLPMYSNVQIAQGIQGMYASTGYRGGSAPLGTMTDIMGLAAITGMDPSQLMGNLAYLSGSSGQGQNMGSYSTSIGMLGNLFGNILSPANVTPTLGALSSVVPTLNGISPGQGSQTGQAMAFFQLAQGAGMTPQNFGDVSSLLGSLSQVGTNPNLQQQYTLQKLGYPLTADTALTQFQQEQTSREMQIASLGIQQNINEGVAGINGGRPTGAPLSLPHLQIQIDQAQITMDKAELTMSGLQLASAQVSQQGAELQYQYGKASYGFNLAMQNALYGPIGKDYSQLAGYSFQQNQLVAGRNSTSPEIGTMFTPQNVSGLRNQEFYAGLQNQQQSLILGRSPLLSDALFQQQMKYIAQQADYYKQELALRNQQREFDMVWQKRLLDQQGAQVAAQGRIVAYQGYIYSLQQSQFKLEQEKSVYDQKQAAIQQQYLQRQQGDLEAINTALNQFLNGQGPVGGQNLQPQDLVQKMADQLKSGALSPSSLQQVIRGLGLSPQDQGVMYQLVTQLSKQPETLAQMTRNMNNANDQQVVALFNKLKKDGAFNIQVQTAGQQNAALQQGGVGPNWDQLTANTQNIATAETTIAKVLAPGTPFLQDISAIANQIGPLAVGVGTISNIIGLFLSLRPGGIGGGAPGTVTLPQTGTVGATAEETAAGGGGLAGIIAAVLPTVIIAMAGAGFIYFTYKVAEYLDSRSPQKVAADQNSVTKWIASQPWLNWLKPSQAYINDVNNPKSASYDPTSPYFKKVPPPPQQDNSNSGPVVTPAQQIAMYAQYAKAGGPGTVSTQEANTHLKNMEGYLHQVQQNTGNIDNKTKDANVTRTNTYAKMVNLNNLHTQSNQEQQRQTLILKNSDGTASNVLAQQVNLSVLGNAANQGAARRELILKNSDGLLGGIKQDEDAWAKLATFTKGTGGSTPVGHPGFTTPNVNAEFHQQMKYGIHQGVDFAAAQGTPIGAFNPGRVTNTGFYPWGGEVDVNIGHGLTERYIHLSQIGVVKGEPLLPRQRIGLTGGGTPASGLGYWSSGAHSHVQIDRGNILQGIDPWPIWALLGSRDISSFYGSGWGTTKGHGGPGIESPRKLVEGGIAMKRVMAEIGEGKEPEAVLPLSRLSTLLKSASGSSQPVVQPQPAKAIQVSKLADKFEIHVHTTSAKLDDQAIDDLGAQFFDILTTQLQKL